jgi:hypothetical protein
MVRYYYCAPLPDYLYSKYGESQEQRTKNQDGKNEKYIRFENFLAKTSNEFIGRGAPTCGTATHLLHLKALKNPVDFMRYVKGVVFPGKEFMVEKYGLKSKVEGQKSEEYGLGSEVEGNKIKESKVKGQKETVWGQKSKVKRLFKLSNLQTFKLRFWWLWYGYRWWVALRAVLGLRR